MCSTLRLPNGEVVLARLICESGVCDFQAMSARLHDLVAQPTAYDPYVKSVLCVEIYRIPPKWSAVRWPRDLGKTMNTICRISAQLSAGQKTLPFLGSHPLFPTTNGFVISANKDKHRSPLALCLIRETQCWLLCCQPILLIKRA